MLRPWHGDLSADEPQQAAFDNLPLQTLHHHHQPKRPRPCNLGLRDNPKQLRVQSAANATDTAAGQINALNMSSKHVRRTMAVEITMCVAHTQTLHHHHQPKRPRPCNLGLRDNPKQLRVQSAANATDTAAGQSNALNMSSKHVRRTMAVLEITMCVAHRDAAAIMRTQ